MIKQFLYSKKGLWITVIVFILFLVGVLPYMAALSEAQSNTTFSPDTGFFYDQAIFYEAMALYGESGRQFYIIMRWTFDVVWPIVYTAFFISLIANLKQALNKPVTVKTLSILLLAVVFDFLENSLATINVGIYPNQSLVLLRLLQGATALKWVLIGLTILVILVLSIQLLVRKLKQS